MKATTDVLSLDRDYILSKSFPVFPQCGIYFLIQDDEIVYIGQSVHIPNRLKTHQGGEKVFNKVFFVECSGNDLDELEKHYIRSFTPKLNKKLYRTSRAWRVKKEKVDKAAIRAAEKERKRLEKLTRLEEIERWSREQYALDIKLLNPKRAQLGMELLPEDPENLQPVDQRKKGK